MIGFGVCNVCQGWISDVRAVRFDRPIDGLDLDGMEFGNQRTEQSGVARVGSSDEGSGYTHRSRAGDKDTHMQKEGRGTILVPCEAAAIETEKAFYSHSKEPFALKLAQILQGVDVISRTSLVRGQVNRNFPLLAIPSFHLSSKLHLPRIVS